MESINRPELVKEHNLSLVRKTLFHAKQATRQQLSSLTGISTVTLGSLLQQLLETGEALETDSLQPASGRPARIYAYNALWRLGLMVSVLYENGTSCLQTALTDLYGQIIWEERMPTRCLDHNATLNFFDKLIHLQGKVDAVSVGLPGVGFEDYLHKGHNSEYFSLTALRELEQRLNIPIRVENDVNLAALGYARSHGVSPEETLVYLYLMKGSYGGSAIYLNGGIHLGKDRCAGEFISIFSGVNWSQMGMKPSENLIEKLLAAVLPYLAILAPHRLVIASDYITQDHLDVLEARANVLLEGRCPSFSLGTCFTEDYREGLKQFVLEELQ